MKMNKKEIIDKISETVTLCIADGNTYLYAKCSPTIERDDKIAPIGGGNFTVLLSTLCTIEFLGTVNFLIDSRERDFYSKNEILKIKVEKMKISKKYKKLFYVPQEGKPKKGSGDIFKNFLKETSGILEIDKREVESLWKIRNKLAHEFTPKIKAALGVGVMPGADYLAMIALHDQKDVYGISSENTIGINSNALNRKLLKLEKYVLEKLESTPESSDIFKKIEKYISNSEKT